MVAAADIKKDLPNFPDEVIDMWLLPLANQPTTGWPPPNPFGSSRWQWILGEKDLDWWKKVDWKLEETDCSFGKLARGTQNTIQKMLAAHIDREENAYGEDPERFFDQLNYVLKHGTFSRPIAVVPVKSGLSVVDGNNRICRTCVRTIAVTSGWTCSENWRATPVQFSTGMAGYPSERRDAGRLI